MVREFHLAKLSEYKLIKQAQQNERNLQGIIELVVLKLGLAAHYITLRHLEKIGNMVTIMLTPLMAIRCELIAYQSTREKV